MSVKQHYDDYLGHIYSWMAGDFASGVNQQQAFFKEHQLLPTSNGVAVDLGAGNGLQSVALANLGFKVRAIDQNDHLLNELSMNSKGLPIEIIKDDILNVKQYGNPAPQLIVCCGDTITHLQNKAEVKALIQDCAKILSSNGKLLITLRDYSNALTGDARFIPVRSEPNRIFLCCLDYEPDRIRVTDILYEQAGGNWTRKLSSYFKVRVLPDEIIKMMIAAGLEVVDTEKFFGMTAVIAIKPNSKL